MANTCPPEACLDFLNRLQPLAQLVMRLVLGAIMIAHGYHKVFGGFHHHVEMVGSLGLPRWLAYLSAGTEFFGGIAIVLGLFTRFFSLAMVIEMGVAIWKVHFKNGLTGAAGYEFPLALAAMAFALLCFDGGPWAARFSGRKAPTRKARNG
jgi:putative oxidoreductase